MNVTYVAGIVRLHRFRLINDKIGTNKYSQFFYSSDSNNRDELKDSSDIKQTSTPSQLQGDSKEHDAGLEQGVDSETKSTSSDVEIVVSAEEKKKLEHEKKAAAALAKAKREQRSFSSTIQVRSPTEFQKIILVATGAYKSTDQVPVLVREAAMGRALSRFHVGTMIGNTVLFGIILLLIHKVAKRNVEDADKTDVDFDSNIKRKETRIRNEAHIRIQREVAASAKEE